MPRPLSAGILMFRRGTAAAEVLLIRPGGPYWRSRDVGAWMIPKGAVEEGETAAETAVREFAEETGMHIQQTPFPLCTVRQAGGKLVEAFAVEGEFDPAVLVSNSFHLEWPPRSGQTESFPELEEARWFSMEDARAMILPSQLPILDALEERLSA